MDNYEYIPDAKFGAEFHGETWFHCPHCGVAFEFYDTQFERDGIKKIGNKIYICGKCGRKYKIR